MPSSTTLVQGDSWEVQVGWYQPLPNGQPDYTNPNDLTGYTAQLQMRSRPTANPVLTLTSSPPVGLTVNGTAGTVDIYATPTQTLAIPPGTYQWEIEVDNGTDNYTLTTEIIYIREQVSK